MNKDDDREGGSDLRDQFGELIWLTSLSDVPHRRDHEWRERYQEGLPSPERGQENEGQHVNLRSLGHRDPRSRIDSDGE